MPEGMSMDSFLQMIVRWLYMNIGSLEQSMWVMFLFRWQDLPKVVKKSFVGVFALLKLSLPPPLYPYWAPNLLIMTQIIISVYLCNS